MATPVATPGVIAVERVLQDVNGLMQKKEKLSNEIEMLQNTLYHPDGIPIPEPKKLENEVVTIPYNMLHYLLSQRNFLLTNHNILQEAIQTPSRKSKKKTGPVKLCHSGGPFKEDISLENIICKFSPSPRKQVSKATREEARKFQSSFLDPEFLTDIPSIEIEMLKGGAPVSMMKGPGHSSADVQCFGNHCCCRTISTYPLKKNHHLRMGDPVCDRYFVKLFENRVVCALADGCNWGESSRSAAKKACKAFTSYVIAHHKKPKTMKEMANIMLEAFADAHRRILETSVDAAWEAGSTTLNGSILLRCASLEDNTLFKWALLYCNVGDCKIFYYSRKTRKASDIITRTRAKIQNGLDPGGRIGPRGGDATPDLRNLVVGWQFAEEDDIIITISDGVYDNLDLRHQGFTPSDVGLAGDDWNAIPDGSADEKNTAHVEKEMTRIINEYSGEDEVTCDGICLSILDFCEQYTESSRLFMMDNPTARLPKDYSKFPGKVDHASVLCYKVGSVSLSYEEWMGK